MSRIWKSQILVPTGVSLEIQKGSIKVKWPKGELSQDIRDFIILTQVEDKLTVAIKDENDSFQKWVWWLTRTLISNMVVWVTTWFEKSLEVIWVWYKFDISSPTKIILSVWFSHKVELATPAWVKVEADPTLKNTILIKWIDKQQVGFFASKIRSIKKPEPYKGKWIRYVGEYVRRKAGKTWGKK